MVTILKKVILLTITFATKTILKLAMNFFVQFVGLSDYQLSICGYSFIDKLKENSIAKE